MTEIKPCPLCGSDAATFSGVSYCNAACLSGDCGISLNAKWNEPREDLIARWNDLSRINEPARKDTKR